MSSRISLSLLSFAGLLIVGCDGGTPKPTVDVKEAVHNGTVVPLPEDLGVVELLNGKPSRTGGNYQATIIAYLLQPDRTTPIESPPKEMIVKIGSADETAKPVTLKLDPTTSEPTGSARYTSAPGPYEIGRGGTGGTVEVTVGGKAVSAPFRSR